MRVRRDAIGWAQRIVGRECESAHFMPSVSLGRFPAKKDLNLDGAPAFRESDDGDYRRRSARA